MYPVELIAIDIDGTLLNSQQRVSERSTSALQIAEASGAQVVLSTGQDYASAALVRQTAGIKSHAVCSNGALVTTADGVVLKRKVLGYTLVKQILIAAECFQLRRALTFEPPAGEKLNSTPAISRLGESSLDSDLTAIGPLQITFFGARAQVRPLVRALAQMPIGDQISISISRIDNHNCVADIGPAGATKGTGLALLCAHLAIPRCQVAAIGDNFNDSSMLEFAAYPFLVANSPEAMKNKGWRIVPSNDDDGVAHAIEYLLAEPMRSS